ncbi:hypothetical protein ACIA8O_13575 [Kitasatospora sp. NPDC051853]|uniref:hypothetical protein n=1 Tax=Kitasatospora sp. NPDC051853 TaxID=3364058 RepID=UPI0037B5B45C
MSSAPVGWAPRSLAAFAALFDLELAFLQTASRPLALLLLAVSTLPQLCRRPTRFRTTALLLGGPATALGLLGGWPAVLALPTGLLLLLAGWQVGPVTRVVPLLVGGVVAALAIGLLTVLLAGEVRYWTAAVSFDPARSVAEREALRASAAPSPGDREVHLCRVPEHEC